MTTIKSLFIRTCLLCLSAGLLTIASFSATAVSITDTTSKHNLSTLGAGQNSGSTSTEVCVYCHTPHGADANADTPLWNKSLTAVAATGYTRYLSSTIDGSNAGTATSPSLACLSCHDGAQAMDAVINAPGSGGYVAAGASLAGGSGATMTGTVSAPDAPGNFIPNLTTDLSDDHPISIQYAGGGCDNGTAVDCTSAGDFNDKDFNDAQRTDINLAPVWWVDTPGFGTANVRDKTDMFLYTRTDAAAANIPEPFVECGSCHDPHNVDSGLTAETVQFLRVANTSSVVCTTCHDK